MSLEELRDEIKEIDLKILDLIKKRLDIAKKIGLYKKQHQIPVKNANVEEKVLERAEDHAIILGIPIELALDVTKLLIEFSVKIQL